MEWVVISGPTVAEAKEEALDQLGVDDSEAEFEVLEEPRTGLFGRTRGEAKVRARVRPSQPRPKQERRDRRRSGGGRSRSGRGGRGGGRSGGDGDGRGSTGGGRSSQGKGGKGGKGGKSSEQGASGRGRSGGRSKGNGSSGGPSAGAQEEQAMTETMTADEQGELVKGFVEGLLDVFGAEGEVQAELVAEDVVEVSAEGDDLGLLIGPRGNALDAVQELARRSLQRKAVDTGDVRIRVDVGGYRSRRREALDRFAREAAAKAVDSGARVALEPMSAADRKVVHDAVNEVDGVSTVSEGEDRRRRVVIVPDGD